MNVSTPLDERYLTCKEARKILGISSDTLRNWDKLGKIDTIRSPTGIRLYNKEDVFLFAGIPIPTKKTRKVAYCRVSSRGQKDDLDRQIEFFRSNYPDYEVVSDIGSGINWKRKGLNSILEQALQGHIGSVMVAHKDRLSRFGFELIENILSYVGTELIVLDSTEQKSEASELADDVLSIIHVYSCRANGRRRYKSKKNKDLSESETTGETHELDGDM